MGKSRSFTRPGLTLDVAGSDVLKLSILLGFDRFLKEKRDIVIIAWHGFPK